jgi:hypothetical protein
MIGRTLPAQPLLRELAMMPFADRQEVLNLLGDGLARSIVPQLEDMLSTAHSPSFAALIDQLERGEVPSDMTPLAASSLNDILASGRTTPRARSPAPARGFQGVLKWLVTIVDGRGPR